MARACLDSGVLIAAARGSAKLHERALAILSDSTREFVCSDYVHLEVAPKAKFHGYTEEIDFHEGYFDVVGTWLRFDVEHLDRAFEEACASGLSAWDAVHVMIAAKAGCGEFVTTERPTAPIHRTKLVCMVSIDDRLD